MIYRQNPWSTMKQNLFVWGSTFDCFSKGGFSKGGRIFFYVSHLHGPIKQGRSVEIKKKIIKKCILMYNQGNMRLHVDIFIKYVSNNVYSDNNHGQPQFILNVFLTFLVAYTL